MVSASSTPSDKAARPLDTIRYELLTLGDELLLGLTPNDHLTFIGGQLDRVGVRLDRNITLTDEADAIAAQFAESWARADVVITTGGLGPTCDDRTREAVARVLGVKLVFDDAVKAAIEARFRRMGRAMTDNNLKQAQVFDGGDVLPNANGTAPGLWFERDEKIVIMLPGPPNELQPIFVEQVLPRLAERGRIASDEAYVQIRTAGIGESALETLLQPLIDQQAPGALSVAFCAHAEQVDCRLSSPNARLSHAQLEKIAEACARLLGEDFLCFGHDSPAKICADLLRSRELTLAVAESATGGNLSHCFASLCGAAKFFVGGCTCCSNASKIQLLDIPEEILLQHGAASPEGAVAMATGAAERLGADYALAVTGYGAPCCGHGPENPVGSIYIGLYSPDGVWSKKLCYPGPRATVKERVTAAALDWLRRELLRSRSGLSTRPDTPQSRRSQ